MGKEKGKSILKQSIEEQSFKTKWQKGKEIIFNKRFDLLKVWDTRLSQTMYSKITRKEIVFIFKLKGKMVYLKADYKWRQNAIKCSSCNHGWKTQKHISNLCEILNKEAKFTRARL